MEKKQFVNNFISTFCAAWCANNWEECCMEDNHDKLLHPPVEEAVYLAAQAWEEYVEFLS